MAFPLHPRKLELGCGNGAASHHLALMGYEVIGIDISATAIAWAKERLAELGLDGAFVAGSVVDMQPCFTKAQFDLVVDGQSLHCLIGRDRSLCLAEVRRILRPGGKFFVSSMCGVPKTLERQIRYDPARAILTEHGKPYRQIKQLPDLVLEFSDAGFGIEDTTVTETVGGIMRQLSADGSRRHSPKGPSTKLRNRPKPLRPHQI